MTTSKPAGARPSTPQAAVDPAQPVRHTWAFTTRFRRNSFGWRSQPAVQRVREAVTEIDGVARFDPVLAAEGAVRFLERVSPALENVDSSSGVLGIAVNRAIDELSVILAAAPANASTRARWLRRLWNAIQEDRIPWIEMLGDHWGELCVSQETASRWADEFIGITRMALSQDRALRGFFCGTSACLSALLRAQRHAEILELVEAEKFWAYRQWGVRALVAQGRLPEALGFAESNRDASSSTRIDGACEEILLAMGQPDEAYRRYALTAPPAGATYLATFRAIASRYPHKTPADILTDLANSTPGEEGKWFAAAKAASLFEQAIELASRTPCDPKTLTRAARDHAEDNPEFARRAGLLALHWLAQGFGYDITGMDVMAAYSSTLRAAERCGSAATTQATIRNIVAAETYGERFVTKVLGSTLGL